MEETEQVRHKLPSQEIDYFKIVKILLTTDAVVPGIDEAAFLDTAHKAKAGCPISQALAATPIELVAKLVK